jgi:hypothetical protein
MIEILKISLIGFMFSSMTQEEHTLLSWYGKLIEPLPWYLNKPLGGCYKCCTGQLCFWVFLINRIAMGEYDFFEHLFYVSAGIMISMVYNKIYCYLK